MCIAKICERIERSTLATLVYPRSHRSQSNQEEMLPVQHFCLMLRSLSLGNKLDI